MLRYHDLVAVFPPDEGIGSTLTADNGSVTYRAYETRPGNFNATCAALHATDWLDHGILPLVLSHVPLSASEEAALPRYVGWTHLRGALDDMLATLRKLLVDTQETRGLMCVGFIDQVSALAPGGEFNVFCGHGATAPAATEDAIRLACARDWPLAHATGCLLCIRAGPALSMSDFDTAIRALESVLAEDCVIVGSCFLDHGANNAVETVLMSVMPRRLE